MLPYRADHLRTILSREYPALPDQAVRLLASLTATRDATAVTLDHWEDGYDVDPLGAPGPTTETTSLDAGDVLDLSDVVDPAQLGSLDPGGRGRPYRDGGDRIVSSAFVSVLAGGWPETIGAVHGGSSAVPPVNRFGTAFTLPVGEDAPFDPTNDGEDDSPFEYTGAVVVAGEDGTTVTVAGGAPVVLDAGQSHLIDGGLHLGDEIRANRPVGVYLALGDVDHRYEGRLYDLAPTSAWATSYVTPVTSTNASNEVARVFLFNPGADPLSVTVERSNATSATVSVPAGGQANVVLVPDVGARFRALGPFTGLLVITTPESGSTNDASASYNWGVALPAESALTSSVVVPYGPGSSDRTANYNPVWFAATRATTVYVDRDGDPATGPFVAPGGRRYDHSCAVAALVPRVVADNGVASCITPSAFSGSKGTGDADLSGARLFTVDGTPLAAAWGQVPGLQTSNPALDLGATLDPVPEPVAAVAVAKTVYRGNDDGASCADAVEGVVGLDGDEVTFCFVVTNTGEALLGPVRVFDADLGVDELDMTLLPGGSLDRLDPGGVVRLYLETSITIDLVNTVEVLAPVLHADGTASSDGPVTDRDQAFVGLVASALRLEVRAYAGHDGGAACDHDLPDPLTVSVDDDVTWCYFATNTGDTALAPVTITDLILGLDGSDLTILTGDLTQLDAGDTAVAFYEDTPDADVTATATAEGTPADSQGDPLPGLDPVTAEGGATVHVVPPPTTTTTSTTTTTTTTSTTTTTTVPTTTTSSTTTSSSTSSTTSTTPSSTTTATARPSVTTTTTRPAAGPAGVGRTPGAGGGGGGLPRTGADVAPWVIAGLGALVAGLAVHRRSR